MAGRRRKWLKIVGGVLGLAALGLYGFYKWQPWEYDFIEREPPKNNPPVEPEVAKLFSKGTKVLVVTAHPDDAEFYIGGTLTQLGRSGADMTLVLCTDGDKAYYPFEEHEENRKVRQAEQREASSQYGLTDVRFLGYPDGRLKASDELVQKLVSQIQEIKPDYILAFDGDYPPRLSHGDHRRAGEATEKAALLAGVDTWLMRFSTTAPNWARDITKDWPEKQRLLGIHKSQFYGERLTGIVRMVGNRAREAGQKIGVAYAEPFRCTQIKA